MSVNFAPRLTFSACDIDTALPGYAPDEIVISVESDLTAVRQVWRDFERSALGFVYQSFGWVSIWNSTVGANVRLTPQIVLGRGLDGRLLFLLPLAVCRKSGARALVWMGGGEADLKGGLFSPEFLASNDAAVWPVLWRRIRALLLPHDVIHLTDQPEMIAGFRNPFVASRTHRLPSSTHATRLSRNWDSYYRQKRNGSARSLEKRRMRQLEAQGEVRFEVAQTQLEVILLLDWLFHHKAKSLRQIGVADPFAEEAVRTFYFESAKNCFPFGTSHLSVLRLNGKPVSVVLGLVHNRRYYYLVPAFDEAQSKTSPGRLHLRELMRWSIENGLDFVDLGVGDQDYKFHWCEEHVPLFASIEATTKRGHPAAAILSAKASLKRRIKSSHFLWSAAQAVRTQLGRIGLPQ
jgi:CelD/BcsL family acetyltransferase involved in cellulose biosynthesis